MMKKILLLLCSAPIALFAQVTHVPKLPAGSLVETKKDIRKLNSDAITPQVSLKTSSHPVKSFKMTAPAAEQIGTSTYDLQTNNSISRRVLLYPGGKVSVVWTYSQSQGNNFPDRGTAYNHFDGTSWIGQNTTRFEYDRSGWPCVGTVTDGGTQKEVNISHYAAAGAANFSGGLFFYKNASVGSSAFTLVGAKDSTGGQIWPRITTTGGKYVHIVADVAETDKVINGVRNPVVYNRYNMETNRYEVKELMLPGYDASH